MIKYNVLGSSATDLGALADVLRSLAANGKTNLFDTVETNEANSIMTLYKNEQKLFVWDASSSYGAFSVYTGDETYAAITSVNTKCPTFLYDLGGVIYIAKSTTAVADAHTSWLAIAPSHTGQTAFLIHTGSSNIGQNVYCNAYGDQISPNPAMNWTPNTQKNCMSWYPIPTNAPPDAANYALDATALSYTMFTLATMGKIIVDNVPYYSNGYVIFRDRSEEI